ncbi:phosphoribosylformylglycinamidine synthase subunit PurL [Pelagibacteraceae bacterium]|jgi:phosphoribosylformylglycinamidine synthase subunit PurL|nr:phosphoribosylformylglycinamidine synthase subunit PurL [Pelagibacteraceae bacterium]
MKITSEIVNKHGITEKEYKKIVLLMGREPNLLELGIFSAMWNEHCSYKSSKKYLKTLPTKNEKVIQGPGENAGIIDIEDNDAVVFKIESHNHPSFIEPYQGAATGVGGILRDIFTMGARPIATLNSIHFGNPDHPKTKNLLSGVVSGIGGYGNCIGIPTVGGEVKFNSSYNENILVNAMAVGLVKKNKIFYSKAKGVDQPVIYVGSKTGRDGIHGASMASAKFDDKTEEKKPTVQVGDPFTEKLLLEACLELMKQETIISIQDMGAAGLTSSSVEMASKGNLGIEINLDKIPCREERMSPYEMMLSESQERMLIILKSGKEKSAEKIFNKWGLDFAIIGKTTNSKNLVLNFNKTEVGNIPLSSLSDKAPIYNRKWKKNSNKRNLNIPKDFENFNLLNCLKKILESPNNSEKSWVWEQFDHAVMGDTVQKPGGDSAVVRIHGKNKGVAITVDSSTHYSLADAISGGKQVVCESWRNLISVGSKPIAITNCLNFGNPEKEKIMGQFIETIDGITQACTYLDFPVVSGNVSFYNETNNKSISPTPTIGGVGLIKNLNDMMTKDFKELDSHIIVVGKTTGHLCQSEFFREVIKYHEGPPPKINLFNEKNNGLSIINLISKKIVNAVHDISAGGILIALYEMCSSNAIGAKIKIPKGSIKAHEYFFGEDQSRYLIEVNKKNIDEVCNILDKNSIYYDMLGKTQKDSLSLVNEFNIKLVDLDESNSQWFKKYFEES